MSRRKGRSPDEAATRDYVALGRLPNERRPTCCCARSTRPACAWDYDGVGTEAGRYPHASGPQDIASRRGIDIDTEQLSTELGVQVVTSAAVRRGGTLALLSRLDAAIATEVGMPACEAWRPPSAAELRTALREADRIIRVAVKSPSRPDTVTARLDATLLRPVAGLLFLLTLLFVMLQTVFVWAQPLVNVTAGECHFGGLRPAQPGG